MTYTEIAVTVLTSSAFTGLLVEIIRTLRRAFDKRKNKGLAKLESDVDAIKKQIDKSGKKMEEIFDELERQKETELVLLHDRIWEIFYKLQDKEYVTVEDLANLEYLYAEYKEKDGNHHAEIMFNEIEKKPVKPSQAN